jgi:hypothetical protein
LEAECERGREKRSERHQVALLETPGAVTRVQGCLEEHRAAEENRDESKRRFRASARREDGPTDAHRCGWGQDDAARK